MEASFTLKASPAPTAPLTVSVLVTQSGDYAAAGATGAKTVTIPVTGTISFTVATVNDSSAEANGSITVTVSPGSDYRVVSGASARVAVLDDDTLLISVADATVKEAEGAELAFRVWLNQARTTTVKVKYATRNGTATAGEDYVAAAGRLSFAPGETEKRITVAILDDSHDEGSETMELVMAPAPGSRQRDGARFADNVGIGTISNSDPLPRAWLIRFGRTVSQQVVDALQARFTSSPASPGLELTVAGEELSSAPPLQENQQVLAKLLGFETVSSKRLVQRSSFSFAPPATPVQFSLWGQGVLTSFSGEEETISLNGEVSTALLGAEWSRARWQAGAALSHSWSRGSYGEDRGKDSDLTTTLTGVFPYGRYALTPRLNIWATAGYGWGSLSLKGEDGGGEYHPDINLSMTAAGMDGVLRDGGAEGLSLTTSADLLMVQTTSAAVEGLASSAAAMSRLRAELHATKPFPLEGTASLTPSLRLGIRQDRGDAETGFGMEWGAALSWLDPQRGMSAELTGRSLLTHTEEDFREQGFSFSFSFSWDPTPTDRGPSFSLSHAIGATADSGINVLLQPTALEALDTMASSGHPHQLETTLAYGFPAFGDRLTITPALSLALSSHSTTYGLLWALAPSAELDNADPPWALSLEAERQHSTTANSSPLHSLALRFSRLF